MQIGKYSLGDPIAAIATALSPAALGIVRTSGEGAIDLASAIFSKPKKLKEAQGNSILHGWVLDPNQKKKSMKLRSAFIGNLKVLRERIPSSLSVMAELP